jgi:ATP-dependent helicase/nuclease subunit A
MRRGPEPAPDQAQRDAAVRERRRNVLIDAGAGTGKTTILIDRLVEMLAPTTGAPPVPIERMAAITFTRKAAGELRLRIRERILGELAGADAPPDRHDRLRGALAALDTAYVGTIHSFADRLLRLRPVEAELSPSYEIAEDEGDLVHETYELLLHAVQNGTLAAELGDSAAAARAAEATATVLFALDVGVLAESREAEFYTYHGLDGLVRGFIGERDVPPPDVEGAAFDAAAFRQAADEFLAAARRVSGASQGARWLQRLAATLQQVRSAAEPLVPLRAIRRDLERMPPRQARKGDTFAGDDAAWKLWKHFIEGKGTAAPLRERICGPLDRWLATRLARLFPVVVTLYEKVKARHRALDQLDLLVKLRDLLLRDLDVRRDFQAMFDHIFVDEFQDTDPLQAEIVLLLCERGAVARRWEEVVPRDGSLTLVGDPKQSIYRFRRADIGVYDRVRAIVGRADYLPVTLSANFRSTRPLIAWFNDRFQRILGVSEDGCPFDPATGRVFHRELLPGRAGAAEIPVHVLPFDFPDAGKHKVDEYRALEGEALAQYLRWLVEQSGRQIQDPLDGRMRPVRYGDIAILAVTTWRLPRLFPWLDAAGIPYASRGGILFLSDPLHRQFLLGLRALADRDDGVAEAALLRPPFFAVDPAELLRERANGDAEAVDEGIRRVREARELVRELRRRRFERSPGSTARELLTRTAFARSLALGPNAEQRLARARELCLVLEQTAAAEGLDYDTITARLREWVGSPVQLDPPHPVGTEAVHVLTVHQAKGLEFPVVVLWDGKGAWDTRLDTGPWKMERDGRGWIMGLHGLGWEEPPGMALRQTERQYLDAERRRVVYVAATRARDLLVVPRADTARPGKMICPDLLDGQDARLAHEMPIYRAGFGAPWAVEGNDGRLAWPAPAGATEQDMADRWVAASGASGRPRYRPASVSGEADATPRDEAAESGERPARKPREGRFGSVFGHTVHHAIGLVLHDPALAIQDAVARAASAHCLSEHLADAVADVKRAVEALRREAIEGPPGPRLQVEYPVAGAWDVGQLLTGFVDLVAMDDERLDVIDFKTDAPPSDAVELAYPEYAAQVGIYAEMLQRAGVRASRVRFGLLFTGDGVIRWLPA